MSDYREGAYCRLPRPKRARQARDDRSRPAPDRLRLAWQNMRKRCSPNANNACSRYYAQRGIRVCDRWQNSFEAFEADMGPHPGTEYTLDRIDTNGHYEPGNCRWATRKTQQRNRRMCQKYTIDGERLTAAEICARSSLSESTLRCRLSNGWDPKKAMTTPPDERFNPRTGAGK